MQPGTYVVVLHHVYPNTLDPEVEESKLIGCFSSQQEVTKAIESLNQQDGFRDHQDGWMVSEYAVNEVHWEDVFLTLDRLSRRS